jgi:hypothetical protein
VCLGHWWLCGVDELHSFRCFLMFKTCNINMLLLIYMFKYYNYVSVSLWSLTFFWCVRVIGWHMKFVVL